MRMKLAILNITGGGMSGGYKKYLLNVIPRLAAHSAVDSLLCVSAEQLNVHAWFTPMRNVEFTAYPPFSFIRGLNGRLQKKLEQFTPDIIFTPVERPVKFRRVPVVTMIQNMEPLAGGFDGGYSLPERMKCRLQYAAGKIAVKKAARVIAISGFVRDFLIKTWHIPREKIGLVYHGLSRENNMVYTRPEAIPADWEGEFLFTAGSIRPARGLEDLVFAAQNFDAGSLGIKGVVIAGETVPDMLKYKQRLLTSARAANTALRFIFLEGVSPPQMAWCYAHCRVFVMTSRVESFGLIGLEAMAHGCLCVAADNPCLPEIFGSCAVYYTPKDAIGLAHAIRLILTKGKSAHAEISRLARSRAAEFSWDKTVDSLVGEFADAMKLTP